MDYLSFRNFRRFERTRREIKLPCDLLNDIRFRQLPDARKAHLICLLLLSAQMSNLLPNSPTKLERMIGATEPLDLGAFADFVDFAVAEVLATYAVPRPRDCFESSWGNTFIAVLTYAIRPSLD